MEAKELEKLSGQKVKEIHKPEIDEITIPCPCGNKMKRINEVLDVWFDSGVSSWAALGYMEDKAQFNKFWPANLNLEGKDQIRGWWNSQFILSEIKFGKKPFDNIMVHGMVLDMGKKKMSKSEGNVISPATVIERYNRDFLRYYFAKISKGEDFSFQDREFKEIRKTFMMLSNVARFVSQLEDIKPKKAIEDKWILSKYNKTIQEVTEAYNKFNFPEVTRLLDNFLVNDLSRTYIKIIRDRADETKKILEEILIGTIKLFAPIAPFTTEKIWQELDQKEESIHLSLLPKSDKKKIDEELEQSFSIILGLIEKGLSQRDKEGIGLKWPLAKAELELKIKLLPKLEDIIKAQLNIRKIESKTGKENIIRLDTNLTPELEAEGFAREISRKMLATRKKAELIKTDSIELTIDSEFNDKLETQLDFIKERVGAKTISLEKSRKKFSHFEEGKIKGKTFKIAFNKI